MKRIITYLLLAGTCMVSFHAQSQQYRTGLDLEKGDSKGLDIYEMDAFGFGENLPNSLSLRMYAPYPGNQGSYGTCVGWSFGYCGMTTLFARQFDIKNRNVVTAMAMCPYTVYNNIKSEYDESCSRGSYLKDAGEHLVDKGTKRFHIRESDCGTTDEIDEGFMIYKADSYEALWEWGYDANEEEKKTEKTKSALADGNIVLIGMRVPASFGSGVNEDGAWIKSDDAEKNKGGGGHAMCVLGYDDNRLGGSFEIQNSWGQDWGDGGYVYVTYSDFQTYVERAVSLTLDEDSKWNEMMNKEGCLFGDCSTVYSRFSFSNGDSYEGAIKNGMPDGYGIYQWSDGDVYTGEFKEGIKEGKGTYFYSDGSVSVGRWVDDEYRPDLEYLEYEFTHVGLGDYAFNGYAKGKEWLYGDYDNTYKNKNVYRGKFGESNAPHDFGMIDRSYKQILSEFDKGQYSGYSVVFTTYNYEVFESVDGEFETVSESNISKDIEEIPEVQELQADSVAQSNGNCEFGTCMNGYSRLSYGSENSYKGFLVNGWRHGYGEYTFSGDGKVKSYEGGYKFGERSGLGKLVFSDGGWFIGEFKSGKADGKGYWVKADGTIQAGRWEDGEYLQEDEGFGFADGEEEISMETDTQDKVMKQEERKPKKFGAPIVLK